MSISPDPSVEIAIRLRSACEAHDASIAPHLDRVAGYSCEIGKWIGLSPSQLIELRYAAPLHDLGKIGLSPLLLNKPGRLTQAETKRVRTHTVIGHRILDGSDWPLIQSAARIALSHHECWSGGGYPNGVAGDNIPLEARIVAVADVYDALMSERVYKPIWKECRVIAEMRRLRGGKFDPEIVDAFLDHLLA